jgi:murein DD-endopeptidase MepM/ murein hydrolase activator NlpD
MERIMSVEEKIKKAEEIYKKRRQDSGRQIPTVNLSESKKELKLFKKMLKQLLVCIIIYFTISTVYNNDYVFSEDFKNKTKELLSYDINFVELYENIKNEINEFINNNEKNQNGENGQDTIEDNNVNKDEEVSNDAIGGAIEVEENSDSKQLSQAEQDIIDTINTTTFIKPIEGVISSKYGIRETATGNVPKNHTGIDIAANLGTRIKSSTNGEVVLASEEGDYGKHLKIQIGEVSVIYAHCNNLLVKQGDKVVQGQEIAEVGSTGNSTGPHLHFEIRVHERTVDPQSILEL